MYFIRYQPLKELLNNQEIKDKEALPYFILFSTLQALSVSFPIEVEKLSKWDTLGGIIYAIITIIGVLYAYKKNGGSSGYDFIQKYVVLGWVVCIRCIIGATLAIIIIVIGADYFFDVSIGNSTTLIDVVLVSFLYSIFYERLGRHIEDTNKTIKK